MRISAITNVPEIDNSITSNDYGLLTPSVCGQTSKSKKSKFETTDGRFYESRHAPGLQATGKKKKKKRKRTTSLVKRDSQL